MFAKYYDCEEKPHSYIVNQKRPSGYWQYEYLSYTNSPLRTESISDSHICCPELRVKTLHIYSNHDPGSSSLVASFQSFWLNLFN